MARLEVLIGLPVYRRAWILPLFLEAIERQEFPLENMGFIFELGPNDDDTHEVLWRWHERHPQVCVFDGAIREDIKHETHPTMGRRWNQGKYLRMVEFRNSLLDRAIALNPDRYFSLDSDLILENPHTISYLYHATTYNGAASPLSYMKYKDTQFPSVMTWYDRPGGRAYRDLKNYPIGNVFKADIIMAAVMMSRDAYQNSRYRLHKQGEDLGWSWSMAELGLDMWCASNFYAAHIMHQPLLEDYLVNGDPRSTVKQREIKNTA